MPEPETVFHEGDECYGPFRREQRYPCPGLCGAALCSLECIWAHRDKDSQEPRSCVRKRWEVPKFGERFAGPHAPLTHAVAQMGGVEVQKPYDVLTGSDFFTQQGRDELEELCSDPFLYAEHWAPECKLFSRARGRPIRLRSGRFIQGPRPVRDAKHVMGFSNLPPEMKIRLRKSNGMALKALKRGEHVSRTRQPRHWTCEHPKNSWLWEFTLVKRLEEEGFVHAHGSNCCWGGLREKYYSFFRTSRHIYRQLSRVCQGHEGLLTYEVEERQDGTLYYPTEEESEYPWSLCLAYARGLKTQMEEEQIFDVVRIEAREEHYLKALRNSTARLQDPSLAKPVASYLTRLEHQMKPGEELLHLQDLLRAASMRGTDIRLGMHLGPEDDLHEVPYPAMRWRWATITSYPWKQTAHINELEMNAFVVMSKHRGRTVSKFHTRWMHVLDSTVTRGALAKGRSSSVRLNRPLRKHAASSLAQNAYCFPLWTISGWNFSDKASRRHG